MHVVNQVMSWQLEAPPPGGAVVLPGKLKCDWLTNMLIKLDFDNTRLDAVHCQLRAPPGNAVKVFLLFTYEDHRKKI